MPVAGPIFERYVASHGLQDRLKFTKLDFFKDPFPKADVIIMGHILHDWDLPTKKMLIGKAFDALPQGGSLILFEAIIDDERKTNAFGLLMSLIVDARSGLQANSRRAFERAGFDGGWGEMNVNRGTSLPCPK